MTHTAFIAIGSNLGEREGNCERAVLSLGCDTNVIPAEAGIQTSLIRLDPCLRRDDENVEVLKVSKQIPSKALTASAQETAPDYINQVVKISTSLSPEELLARLQSIEKDMGRVRTGKKWESRIIDLDILFYDDLIIDTPTLTIPHPDAHKRTFVLEPMCDIEPTFIHPILKRSMYEILHRLG